MKLLELLVILLAAACTDLQQSIPTSAQTEENNNDNQTTKHWPENGHPTTTKTITTLSSYEKETSLVSEEMSKTMEYIFTDQEYSKNSQQTHLVTSQPVSLPMENTKTANESPTPTKTENILDSSNSTVTGISPFSISDSELASTTANDLQDKTKTDYSNLSTIRSDETTLASLSVTELHAATPTLTRPTQSDVVIVDELVITTERPSAETTAVFPTLTFQKITSATQEFTSSRRSIRHSLSELESPSPAAALGSATSNKNILSTLPETSSPPKEFFTKSSAVTSTTDYLGNKGPTDYTSVDSRSATKPQTSDIDITMASNVAHSNTNSIQTSSTTQLVTQGSPTKWTATEPFSTEKVSSLSLKPHSGLSLTESHSTAKKKNTTLETLATHPSASDIGGSTTQNVNDVATLETTATSRGSQGVTMSTSNKTSQSYKMLPNQTAVEKTQRDSAQTQPTITISKGFTSTPPEQYKSPTMELPILATTSSIGTQSLKLVSQTVKTTVTYPAPFSVTAETPITLKLTTPFTIKNQAIINSNTFVHQSTTMKPTTTKTQQSSIFVTQSIERENLSTKGTTMKLTSQAQSIPTQYPKLDITPTISKQDIEGQAVTIHLQNSSMQTTSPMRESQTSGKKTMEPLSAAQTTVKSKIKASTTMVESTFAEGKSQTTDVRFSEPPSAAHLLISLTNENLTASNFSEVLQPLGSTVNSTIKSSTTEVVSNPFEEKSQTTNIKSTELLSTTQVIASVSSSPTTLNFLSEVVQQPATTIKSSMKKDTAMDESTVTAGKSETANIKSTEPPIATQVTSSVTPSPLTLNSPQVLQQLATNIKSTIKASTTMDESTFTTGKSQTTDIGSSEPPSVTQLTSSVTPSSTTLNSFSEVVQQQATTITSSMKKDSTIDESTVTAVESETTNSRYSEPPIATQVTSLVTSSPTTLNSYSEGVQQPATTIKLSLKADTTMDESTFTAGKLQTTNIKSTEPPIATQLTSSVTPSPTTLNSSQVLQQLATTIKSTIKASTTMVESTFDEGKSQTTDIGSLEPPSATQVTSSVKARSLTTSSSSETVQQPDTTVKVTIKPSTTKVVSGSSVGKSQTTDINSTEPQIATQVTSLVTPSPTTLNSYSEGVQIPATTTKSSIKEDLNMDESTFTAGKSETTNIKSTEPPIATKVTSSVTPSPTTLNSLQVMQQLATNIKSTIKASTTMVESTFDQGKSQTTDIGSLEPPSATQETSSVKARSLTTSSSSEAVQQPDTTVKVTIKPSTTKVVSGSSVGKLHTIDTNYTETPSSTQLPISLTNGNLTALNFSDTLQPFGSTVNSTLKASTTVVVSTSFEEKSQTTNIKSTEPLSATQVTSLVTPSPTALNSSQVLQQPATTIKSTIRSSTTLVVRTYSEGKSHTTDLQFTEPLRTTHRISPVTAGIGTTLNSSKLEQPLVTTTKLTEVTNTAFMRKQDLTYFTPSLDQKNTTSLPNLLTLQLRPTAPPQSTSMLVTFTTASQETLTNRNVLSTKILPSSTSQTTVKLTSLVPSGTVKETTGLTMITASKQGTNKSSATIPLENTSVEITHTKKTTDFDTTETYKQSTLTTVTAKDQTVLMTANEGLQPRTVDLKVKASTTNRVLQSSTFEPPSTDQKDTTSSTLQTAFLVTTVSPQRLSSSDNSSTKNLTATSTTSASSFQFIFTKYATTTTASTVSKQVTNKPFFTTALQNTSTQIGLNRTLQTPDQKATETYSETIPNSQLEERSTLNQTTSLTLVQRPTIASGVSPSHITTVKTQPAEKEDDAIASFTKNQQTTAKQVTDKTTPSGSEFASTVRGLTTPTTLSMETTATHSFAPTASVSTSSYSTATSKEMPTSPATVIASTAALAGAASVKTTTARQTTITGTPHVLESTTPGKTNASLSTPPLLTATMQTPDFKDDTVSPSQGETMTMSSQGPFTEASSKSARTEITTAVEFPSPALMSSKPAITLVTFSKGTTQYTSQGDITNSSGNTQMSSSVTKDTQAITKTKPVIPLVSGLFSAATSSSTSPMAGKSPNKISTPPATPVPEKTVKTDSATLGKSTRGLASSISPSSPITVAADPTHVITSILNDTKTAPNAPQGVSLLSSKSTDGSLSTNQSSLRFSSTEAADAEHSTPPMEVTTKMKMVSQTLTADVFSSPTSQRTVTTNSSSNASISSTSQSSTTQKQSGASSSALMDSMVFFKLPKVAVVTRLVFDHPAFVRTQFMASNATN